MKKRRAIVDEPELESHNLGVRLAEAVRHLIDAYDAIHKKAVET